MREYVDGQQVTCTATLKSPSNPEVIQTTPLPTTTTFTWEVVDQSGNATGVNTSGAVTSPSLGVYESVVDSTGLGGKVVHYFFVMDGPVKGTGEGWFLVNRR